VASLVIAAAGLSAYAYGGDVPRGTQVLGVDIGGRSRTDAEHVLHNAFDRRADEPVEVEEDGVLRSIRPAAIGMTLSVDLTVGRAIRGGHPMLTGKRSSPPVIHLDRGRLKAALGLTGDPAAATTAVKDAWLTGHSADIRT
jgi:hypothetical protein